MENHKDIKVKDTTYFDRDIEKEFMNFRKFCFKEKTEPRLFLGNQIGHMYTPSLYGGLVSLLMNKPAHTLAGERMGPFTYGSGLVSSFYSIRIWNSCLLGPKLHIMGNSDSHILEMLESRKKVSHDPFSKILGSREQNHHKAPYSPFAPVEHFFPGTWYLKGVDVKYRRSYGRDLKGKQS